MEFWQLEDQTPKHTKRHHGSVFTLREMEEATNSFSEENLLGKGGFGRVYRGTLQSGEVCSASFFLNKDILMVSFAFFWKFFEGGGR